MAGGYRHVPQDVAAIAARFRASAKSLDDIRRAASNATLHTALTPATPNVDASLIPIHTGTVGAVAIQEAVSVPAGFTSASVLLTVALDGLRDASTGGGNTLTIQAFADTELQNPLTRTFATAGTQASVTQSFAATVSGLSGPFNLGALGWGSSGWVANSGTARLSALVVFLR